MSLAITPEHQQLAEAARDFLVKIDARAAARGTLDGADEVPGYWPQLAAMGWLGLHVDEALGGEGFGLPELAIVVEELGRAVAPGAFVPTVVAAAVVAEHGTDELRARWLPTLIDGSELAGVAVTPARDGAVAAVVGGQHASLFVLPEGDDVAVYDTAAATVEVGDDLDTTRRSPRVRLSGEPLAVLPGAMGTLRRLTRLLLAAEAVGVARGALGLAVEYAKLREQFGRPIGAFQAVKHHCADMLVDTELAGAAVWHAGRGADDLAVCSAALLAARAALAGTRTAIQVHGGVGFTWEHDAHLYLRRAASLAALIAATGDVAVELSDGIDAGSPSGGSGVALPAEADTFRAEALAFRARLESAASDERRALLAESGYLVPHWPAPWGRGAGPVEQLVIDDVLDGVDRPDLGIGGWVLLTVVQHATADQLERWVGPGLRGDSRFCQLFSEPGAGSDAASISTRAVRTDGGWLLNGQKVWISDAANCQFGLITVRTNPDAPKHKGITTMVLDLHTPGVDVRPLREITGDAYFNEIFLDDVFVPDTDVVGEVDAGWTVARATLGNERVSIGGSASGTGARVAALSRAAHGDPGHLRAVGELLAEAYGLAALNLRIVERAVVGVDPGAEGAVTKLVLATHSQRVDELALHLAGLAGVTGSAPDVAKRYLFGRCTTIAGGTSEILRNQIGERILGLPRDPLLKR